MIMCLTQNTSGSVGFFSPLKPPIHVAHQGRRSVGPWFFWVTGQPNSGLTLNLGKNRLLQLKQQHMAYTDVIINGSLD